MFSRPALETRDPTQTSSFVFFLLSPFASQMKCFVIFQTQYIKHTHKKLQLNTLSQELKQAVIRLVKNASFLSYTHTRFLVTLFTFRDITKNGYIAKSQEVSPN